MALQATIGKDFALSVENRASLKVAEADVRDAGMRIARGDPEVADKLGLETDDALEVISPSTKKKMTALHWPAY